MKERLSGQWFISATRAGLMVLAVTEPTLSGLHDLKRILEVANHFNIPAMVCAER